VDNFGGVLKTPSNSKDDFSLDLEKIENAISKKTKAVLIKLAEQSHRKKCITKKRSMRSDNCLKQKSDEI